MTIRHVWMDMATMMHTMFQTVTTTKFEIKIAVPDQSDDKDDGGTLEWNGPGAP